MSTGKMKIILFVGLFAVCSLIQVEAWSEWIPGIIHIHTTFSDGWNNIPERVARAQEEGCRFIIITDHYEKINEQEKSRSEKVPTMSYDYGFEDYFRNCQEQTNEAFLTIPGAEIDSDWLPEPNAENVAHSHLLALRLKESQHFNYLSNDYLLNPLISQYQCQRDTQLVIVQAVNGFGWIPVAAHPNLIGSLSDQTRFWRDRDSRFDFRDSNTISQLQGYEIFNTETDQQLIDNVREYIGWISQGKKLFVTSGCDSHITWLQKFLEDKYFVFSKIQKIKDDDDIRWSRKTWVYSDRLEIEPLLQAICEGHTYAAQLGASFRSLNYIPGFNVQDVTRAEFHFEVAFNSVRRESPEVVIYRDGEIAYQEKKEIIDGAISCSWTDQATSGQHCYVAVVPGYLVTSPILLNICETSLVGNPKSESEPKMDPGIIDEISENVTGPLMPIVGRTKEEIVSALGLPKSAYTDMVGMGFLKWEYEFKLSSQWYKMTIGFRSQETAQIINCDLDNPTMKTYSRSEQLSLPRLRDVLPGYLLNSTPVIGAGIEINVSSYILYRITLQWQGIYKGHRLNYAVDAFFVDTKPWSLEKKLDMKSGLFDNTYHWNEEVNWRDAIFTSYQEAMPRFTVYNLKQIYPYARTSRSMNTFVKAQTSGQNQNIKPDYKFGVLSPENGDAVTPPVKVIGTAPLNTKVRIVVRQIAKLLFGLTEAKDILFNQEIDVSEDGQFEITFSPKIDIFTNVTYSISVSLLDDQGKVKEEKKINVKYQKQ